MNRAIVALPFAVWFAISGCGDSENPGTGAPAGNAGTSAGGSGAADGSPVGGSAGAVGSAGAGGAAGAADAGRWDGGQQPKTLLQAGDGIQLHGITADGYVIYYSQADTSLRAVPVWGGPSEVIYPGGARVSIRGRTVFAAPPATASVPFTIWRHGQKLIRIPGGPVMNSVYSVDDAAAIDTDGKRIVFTRDVGGVLHWIGANVDLTNEVELAIAGIGLCAEVYFAAGHFVTTGCPESGSYLLDSWDASWQRTSHHAGPNLNLTYDGVQVVGDRILFGPSQSLKWVTPGSSQVTTLLDRSVYGFVASRDGAWVVYYGGEGTHVSAVAPWAPVTVGISMSSTLGQDAASFSPNNAYVAAKGSTNPTAFASVTTGATVAIDGATALVAGGFTTDSRYVLYSSDQGIFAAPVDGRPAISIAPLRSYTVANLVAARGARIVYANQETEQLLLRDLDSTAAPVVLSEGTGSPANTRALAVTAEHDSVVYVVNNGETQHGLFAIGVP